MLKTLALLTLVAGLAAAQMATFTFGGLPSPFSQNQGRCTGMTSWNGIEATDPNNPFPQDMGGICLDIYPAVWTNIDTPWQLGFPNSGFLTEGQTTWQTFMDNGNGTATRAFTATGFYDGGSTTVSATVNYQRVSQVFCGRAGCHPFYAWQVIGGSGTVANNP